MRALIFFVVLAAVSIATWFIIPLLEGRDANFFAGKLALLQGRDADFEGERRLVGALMFLEKKIEASSPEVVNADVFHSPSMEPAKRDNLWILTGVATVTSPAGETTNQRYFAVVEASCRPYARRDCWRLEKLTLGERALAMHESAAGGPREVGGEVAATPTEATSTPSSQAPGAAPSRALSGRTKGAEAGGATREAAKTRIGDEPGDRGSTTENDQAKELGQQQLSLAPPVDPENDTAASAIGAVPTQQGETVIFLDHIERVLLGHGRTGEEGAGTKASEAQPAPPADQPSSADMARARAERLQTPSTGSSEDPLPLSGGRHGAAPASEAAESAAPPVADATRGDESLIFLVQARLRQLGLDPGPLTLNTKLGPQARAAIEQYQREHSLAVDGQVTVALLDHLERVLLGRGRTGEEGAEAGRSSKPTARVGGYEHFQKGFAVAKDGRQDLAIDHYTRAIESGDLSQEHLAYTFSNRGVSYWAKGLFDRAIEDFDEAIRLKPDYAQAYHNRSIAYLDRGLDERAIADLDNAIRLEPDYATAYFNRGLAYDRKGLYNRASDDYSKAILLQPDLDSAYFNRGRMHEAKGRQPSALQDFQRAYSLAPSDSNYRAKMKKLGLLQ